MKHIYLKKSEIAKEARGYFMDYLKLQATLCTAAILVSISLYKDIKNSADLTYLLIALILFIGSIVLTVVTKSIFISYLAEYKKKHKFSYFAGRFFYILSLIAFGAGFICLMLMLQYVPV
jgi:hypothetical protein